MNEIEIFSVNIKTLKIRQSHQSINSVYNLIKCILSLQKRCFLCEKEVSGKIVPKIGISNIFISTGNCTFVHFFLSCFYWDEAFQSFDSNNVLGNKQPILLLLDLIVSHVLDPLHLTVYLLLYNLNDVILISLVELSIQILEKS